MRLIRTELRNVCQFARLDVDWHPGLNGIVGPNGAGKSNLLKAVAFALCGEFANDGAKADNVCQLGTGPASVKLSFEHAGTAVVVERFLSGSKKDAATVGGREYHGDKAVTAAIFELLGCGPAVLKYLFVDESELVAFITDGPKDRAAAAARLFGVEEAERAYLALDAEAKAVERELGDGGALRDAERRHAEAADAYNQQLMQFLPAGRLDLAAFRKHEEVLEREATHAAAEEGRRARAWHDERLREARDRVADLERAALEADAAAEAAGPPPDDGLIDELQYEARLRESALKTFASTGVADCPTCGTPSADLKPTLARYGVELPEISSTLAALTGQRREHVARAERCRALGRDLESARRELARIERAAPPAAEPPPGRRPSEAAVQKAREALAAHAHAERAEGERSGALKVLEAALGRARAELDRAREAAAALEPLRRWLEVVQAARAALHRDALPRQVMADGMAELVAGINRNLEASGANFVVSSSPDLKFTVTFADGRVQAAPRLSRGQRVLLALAHRVAINNLRAGRLGLLALDEPSGGLDRRNKAALEVALGSLRAIAEADGLQCLLVTHDEDLGRLCDRTLSLAAPG